MQVTLGEMQVASRLFQIVMAQQDLNGAQVRTGLEEMRRKTVPQRVRMNIFLEAGALGGLLASLPNGFGIDGVIGAMVVMARKEPDSWFSAQALPVLTKFLQQFRTEHHVAVFASLATLDVKHHALAIDVADFQVGQFRAPYSGGVERQQQSAMEGSAGRLNELSNFFLAEDRWQAMVLFRIGSLGDAPGSVERLTVKEPQGCQTNRDATRRQLALLK